MEEKLASKIYNSIREDILSGVIDQRTFLSESELAAKYNVSKAPVRDALHLLCGQGYLVSYPRKGYMVKIYTEEDLRQMQQVRRHLEKLSIELAIENASDEEILSLREYTEDHASEPDPSRTDNTRFHTRLAEISHNSYLPATLQDLLHQVSIFAMKVQGQADFEKHNAIVDALLQRDKEKAIAYLESDILD